MKGLAQFEDDVKTIRLALTEAGLYEQHRDVLARLDRFPLAVENLDAPQTYPCARCAVGTVYRENYLCRGCSND